MSAMAVVPVGDSFILLPSVCEDPDNTATIIIIVVGVVATIVALIVIIRYARKQYLNILEEDRDGEGQVAAKQKPNL